jgi:colicin import membrane protein
MKSILIRLTGAAFAGVCMSLCAQPTNAEEKQRFSEEREAIESKYQQAHTECQKRFSVTSCLKEVGKERAAALEPIRKQELAIREKERKQQAQEQMDKLEKRKSNSSAKQTSENQTRVRTLRTGEITVNQREESQKRHAEKVRSAQEHRQKILSTQQDRKKPLAASLPIPSQ